MAEKRPKKNRFVKAWIDEHVNDHWVKEATRLGYRSRAAFKLIELAERDRLFRPGMSVVDLGAAPGSWTQVLREKLGRRARIVALDLLDDRASARAWSCCRVTFARRRSLAALEAALERPQSRPCRFRPRPQPLGRRIGGPGALRPSGRAGARICRPLAATRRRSRGQGFSGRGIPGVPAGRCSGDFEKVYVRKPKASRDRSREVYLVAKGRKSAE